MPQKAQKTGSKKENATFSIQLFLTPRPHCTTVGYFQLKQYLFFTIVSEGINQRTHKSCCDFCIPLANSCKIRHYLQIFSVWYVLVNIKTYITALSTCHDTCERYRDLADEVPTNRIFVPDHKAYEGQFRKIQFECHSLSPHGGKTLKEIETSFSLCSGSLAFIKTSDLSDLSVEWIIYSFLDMK